MTKTSRAAEVPEPTNRPTVLSVSNSETQNVQLALWEGTRPRSIGCGKTTNCKYQTSHQEEEEEEEGKGGD